MYLKGAAHQYMSVMSQYIYPKCTTLQMFKVQSQLSTEQEL